MTKSSQNERIILGVDPGTTTMGYGIIHVSGKLVEVQSIGIVDLKKFADHYLKLKKIFERSLQLIEQYHPDELSIEAPFYGKNVQSMLKLGRAQGVVMAAALYRNIPIFEYAPRKIKMAITGNGNASKEQVASMLSKSLQINDLPKQLDATDGLAAAVCHYYQPSKNDDGNNYNSWKDFISKNPQRLKN